MLIEEYTPCRLLDVYFDSGSEIELGSYKLKGLGRDIWLMLDGKHTIEAIVDALCLKLAINDKETMKYELIIVLKMLNRKKSIIVNWDPLYKTLLSQEL